MSKGIWRWWSQGPAGDCPGGRATVLMATAPWSPSPWSKWEKSGEGKEAAGGGKQTPPSADGCCAVLGIWCHLCTGYFRKGRWMWAGMRTLSTALCFLECWVWALLSCMSPAHTQCVTLIQSHPGLSHAASTRGLGWLYAQEVKEAQPERLRLPCSP